MNISVFVTEPFNGPNRGNDICYLKRERERGREMFNVAGQVQACSLDLVSSTEVKFQSHLEDGHSMMQDSWGGVYAQQMN